MAAQSLPWLSFNRGLISRLALARIDIARGKLSASLMTNWMPRVLGSMMLRPGLQYIGATRGNNATRMLPFVFSNDDTALVEFTDSAVRVWISDVLITRPTTGAATTNGNFDTTITGWTSIYNDAGATTAWVGGGFLGLTGTGVGFATAFQVVTIPTPNVEHALEIVVQRGPVRLRVGIAPGIIVGDLLPEEYVTEIELQTGYHSIAFVPAGNIQVSFMSNLKRQVLVDSCNVAAAGVMTLTSPYPAAAISTIRADQSGDVIFIANDAYTQRRLARHSFLGAAGRSWSLEQYLPSDGPFRVINIEETTLTPAALSGNTTLTASQRVFRSTHAPTSTNAGALFKIASVGQAVSATITAQNTFTSAIKVIGVGAQRVFTLTIVITSGSATFTLQRSLDSATGPWTDFQTYTTAQVTPIDDGLDNQIVWYRIGVKTGGFGSGSQTVSLAYTVGSITGIARVTGFQSSTVVDVEVIQDFGGTTASLFWNEGDWSDRRGWPTAVAFHDGRLGWAGRDKVWLSVSDAFDSFDDETVGDSGPINRSIGAGPVDRVNWMLSLERLILGGEGSEWSARASSLDEPLTPTAFALRPATTQGSAKVQSVKIDRIAIFVQKSGARVFQLDISADPSGVDYGGIDLTQLVPEVGSPSIVRMAVQRQPDTRVHCVLSDGTVAVLVIDKVENTLCWLKVTTDGTTGFAAAISDVVVLPGTGEDQVYYVVQRTINDVTVRYLEKWALESEAVGGALNKQSDAFVTYTGVATTVITGLSHLEDRFVSVWANGLDVGTDESLGDGTWTQLYRVAGGQITLAVAATNVVVGIPYKSQWRCGKLALQAGLGIPLTKKKRVAALGLITADTHAQGLFFGRDFTHMDPMPLVREGAPVDPNSIISEAEDGSIPFPGEWKLDARICLEARSPRNCTLLAMVADADIHEQH